MAVFFHETSPDSMFLSLRGANRVALPASFKDAVGATLTTELSADAPSNIPGYRPGTERVAPFSVAGTVTRPGFPDYRGDPTVDPPGTGPPRV